MAPPTPRRFRSDDAIPELTVDSSITARPFFESAGFAGFAVVAEQQVALRGVTPTNYAMRRVLD